MTNVFYENRQGYINGWFYWINDGIDGSGNSYGPFNSEQEAEEASCWAEYELEKEAREFAMYEDDPVAYRMRSMYENLY